MSATVTNEMESSRYIARVGEGNAGELQYTRDKGVITFTHTKVSPDFKGQGVGSALVRTGLDDARTDNLRVVAECPFVDRWIQRNPEYEDLLQPR